MLVSLQVRDLAIIDAVDLSFGAGLNVVTGETGAGKSILVDALSLVLGARGTPELVRTGAHQAEVTALFDVRQDTALRARLVETGIEWDDELTIRRIVAADRSGSARSRAYVNGRMVSIAQLGQLAAGLADVTSQHEHQSLSDPATHMNLLDAFGRLGDARGEVSAGHSELMSLTDQLESLLRELRQRTDREDLLAYQVREIDEVGLEHADEATLTAERERLRHATRLRDGTAQAEDALYGGEHAAVDALGRASTVLADLVAVDDSLRPMFEAVDAARVQVEDAARELGKYARAVALDPERLTQLDDTVQRLGRVKRKYGGTLEAVREHRERAASELANLKQGETRVVELERAVDVVRERVGRQARKLSAKRVQAAERLGTAISKELGSLGMGGAEVRVDVTPASAAAGDQSVDGARLGPHGFDRVEFLIAANRGEAPRPLRKIASGGELSRALLAVKRVLTDVDRAGLYVFDEVDTGVGGAIAEVIGKKLAEVASKNQVLVITHLAPIAVYAAQHFVASKDTVGGRTVAQVRRLKEAERLDEVARMIGGIKVTDKTRAAAREMLRDALR